MPETTVNLSSLPRDREFEEFLAAYFQCAGYYIERNIIERELEEVLELDIILTNYNVSPPTISLAEAKSGDWGFPDIFKIRGWMHYTSIHRAWLVTQSQKPNADFYRQKAESIGVRLLQFSGIPEATAYLQRAFRQATIPNDDVEHWRYSYWAERQLIKYLKHCKRQNRSASRYPAMDRYHQTINGGIFFTQNIVDRLAELYSIFREYPRLSAKVGHESQGEPFDQDHETVPSDLFARTYYRCELTDIQVSSFIENASRLAILKNAVDYTLYRRLGNGQRTESRERMLGISLDRFDSLPLSFRTALTHLSSHAFFYRYPLFWQWFLWFFGGFILLDYEEREYEMFARYTGIPVAEIPNALSVFDVLFPQATPWLSQVSTSNVKFMKMHSIPFMGIGANVRRIAYTTDHNFDSLALTGRHTLNDLIHWNNMLVSLLNARF